MMGMQALMEAIGRVVPSPVDMPVKTDGETLKADPSGPQMWAYMTPEPTPVIAIASSASLFESIRKLHLQSPWSRICVRVIINRSFFY